MPAEIFDPLEGHAFDGDHCFLCGIELDENTRTIEHVFPRWLQNNFALRDKTITLLNKTRISYKKLTIPCCCSCNNVHLSQLENRIKSVFLDDSRKLSEIDPRDMNAWISKIYIGILWKELTLNFDRRNPDVGPILSSEVMKNFRMVHAFMQSSRKDMNFHGLATPFPNTIILVDCISDPSFGSFDYLDNMHAHAVAIRIGGKGLICIFDGGLHDYVFPDFAHTMYENKALHPLQFKEVFAKLAYKSMLSLRVPYFVFAQNKETQKTTVTLLAFDHRNMSAKSIAVCTDDGSVNFMPILQDSALNSPAYDDWSQEQYAQILSMYTGLSFEELFYAPDLVRTALRDEHNNFVDMSKGS